jgi:HK97 family phage prohead protease
MEVSSENRRERRFVSLETRAAGDSSKPKIVGLAARFNSPTQIGSGRGSFMETIKPGAFNMCLSGKPDVRCLFNHNEDNVLGRTTSGTLRLWEDNIGLRYECDLPDTTMARDVHAMIKRGDVSQCSFGFTCSEEDWSDTTMPDGTQGLLRSIEQADVFDVSAVTYPAYQQTSVEARSWPDGRPAYLEPAALEKRSKQLGIPVVSERNEALGLRLMIARLFNGN